MTNTDRKSVPREPTQRMIEAPPDYVQPWAQICWRAMYDAAPAPPVAPDQPAAPSAAPPAFWCSNRYENGDCLVGAYCTYPNCNENAPPSSDQPAAPSAEPRQFPCDFCGSTEHLTDDHLIAGRAARAAPSADDLCARLRNTPNWLRQEFGPWKDATSHYDRAPFEAADAIEALTKERDTFYREYRMGVQDELSAAEARVAELEADAARNETIAREAQKLCSLLIRYAQHHGEAQFVMYANERGQEYNAAIDAARAAPTRGEGEA
jgi:hypothetical protein